MILPTYTHIINPKLKNIYLSFDEGANLVIKSPKVPIHQIENLLIQKSSWIQQTQKELANKKGKVINFLDNPVLYFLGDPYPLTLVKHDKKRTILTFENKQFTLSYHHYDELIFQKTINKFYKKEAQNFIPPLVAQWSITMRLYPTEINFRKTKKQWGSCSSKDHLSFNTMVMKLPRSVIQYIVVHELAHIKHKHHQKAFWKLVEKTLPDYQQQIEQLKHYST